MTSKTFEEMQQERREARAKAMKQAKRQKVLAGIGAFFGALILIVVAVAVFSLFNAWLIMLLWGGLGNSFGFFTIGYWQAYLVALALSLVASFFRNLKPVKSAQ